MTRYLARRLTLMILVFFGITLITYSLIQLLPGGPLEAYLGQESYDPRLAKLKEHELGLDRPIFIQYADWLGGLVVGDLGTSLRTRESVSSAILARAWPTLQLGIAGLLLSVVLGVPVGVFAATHHGSWSDWGSSVGAVVGMAMPSFWLAILLITLFSVRLGWLPSSGYESVLRSPVSGLEHLLMPVFALGVSGAAVIMRQTRSSMLEVLNQDYVRTARAKGLHDRTVVYRHALRSGLLPVVTIVGLSVGRLLGGAVIIEQIFAIPGLGRLAVASITGRDFLIVQGVVLVTTVVVLMANLLTDVAYVLLDPRIRLS